MVHHDATSHAAAATAATASEICIQIYELVMVQEIRKTDWEKGPKLQKLTIAISYTESNINRAVKSPLPNSTSIQGFVYNTSRTKGGTLVPTKQGKETAL